MSTIDAIVIRALAGNTAYNRVRNFSELRLNTFVLGKAATRSGNTKTAQEQFRLYVTLNQFVELDCRCVVCGNNITGTDKVVAGKNGIVPKLVTLTEETYADNHRSDSVMHDSCSRSNNKGNCGVKLADEVNSMKFPLNIVNGLYLLRQSEALRKIVPEDIYGMITVGNKELVKISPTITSDRSSSADSDSDSDHNGSIVPLAQHEPQRYHVVSNSAEIHHIIGLQRVIIGLLLACILIVILR
jgi:hypothetical protein